MNKKILIISVILSLFLSFFLYSSKNNEKIIESEFIDNFSLLKQNEYFMNIDIFDLNKIKISFDNSIVILNFFETWCSACNKEFYTLNQFAGKYKDKIKVVSVFSESEGFEEWNKKYNYSNITFVKDEESILAENYKINSIPVTFIIKNKKIIFRIDGERDYQNGSFLNYINHIINISK